MKSISTKKRSTEAEIMDDFELKGEELKKTLNDLENINAWLGGNKITINGIDFLLKKTDKKTITVADVGCGNGGMLRKIARWARKKNYKLNLIGIDANTHAIEIAKKLAHDFPEIHFSTLNIFSEDFKKEEFDIILCTLTLHHFKDEEVKKISQLFTTQANLGVVINDLERSKTAYRLFQAFCKVFINNEIARKDGLISILRGFKKEELLQFSSEIPAKKHHISWKWAFRYQWIIQK
ncbi:methyltransferase domain-containing protein [Mesonia maritima]|uniref:Methyltransferase domain-containing protein n=1 Tax=Mesonia maritima TaxID=1793873 RepID=A0ABU1K7L1_9FLAO|nr:methyltransferase domain-containing protein [Mesonia maritima]MDR6301608.1 hypothetical protein [Mesonia maritima]